MIQTIVTNNNELITNRTEQDALLVSTYFNIMLFLQNVVINFDNSIIATFDLMKVIIIILLLILLATLILFV